MLSKEALATLTHTAKKMYETFDSKEGNMSEEDFVIWFIEFESCNTRQSVLDIINKKHDDQTVGYVEIKTPLDETK